MISVHFIKIRTIYSVSERYRKDDPLPNHIRTVIHYLKKHKKVREDLRWGHQDYFSKYLVARCWPKMRQRIHNWSSKGYIYVLSRILETELRSKVSARADEISAESAHRDNRALAATVTEMVQNGEMESNVMQPSGYSEWNLTHLVSSFSTIGRGHDAYDVTTCFEFHQLLIATLHAYGIALDALKTADKNAAKGMKNLVQKCKLVWVCGNLLSKIASSRMLSQHLAACQSFLYIPIYNQHPTNTNSPQGDSDSGADAGDSDSEADDIDVKGDETTDKVFLKWVRLQASYWLDLALLSRTFGSPDPARPVPEVFLVAMKHPMHNTNPFSEDPLKITLEDVIGDNHQIDFDEVLAVIEEKRGQEHVYKGTIHCEIALAMLILLAQSLSAEDIRTFGFLAQLLQVMFTCTIVVLINLT